MTTETHSQVEETLGQEFWVHPTNSLREEFSLMCAQATQALREEIRERNGGAMDYMIVERLGYMYAHLRQREADGDITDRNRRELLKDWIELATQMKKLWHVEDKDNQSETLLKKVNKAVLEAVKSMPAGQSADVQRALMESFASQGL